MSTMAERMRAAAETIEEASYSVVFDVIVDPELEHLAKQLRADADELDALGRQFKWFARQRREPRPSTLRVWADRIRGELK